MKKRVPVILGLAIATIATVLFVQRTTSSRMRGIIHAAGVYKDKERALQFGITITPADTVRLEIVDLVTKNSLIVADCGSHHSRWFVYWSEDMEELWVYSGDIGGFLLSKNENGEFHQTTLRPDSELPTLVRRMPQPFYDRLGNSSKKTWDQYRK